MKKSYLSIISCLFLGLIFTLPIHSQDFDDIDQFPHDITYYRTSKIAPPIIKVTYGRPAKNNKEIFGKAVPYGEIWRTGANEATEVKFFKDVIFGNTTVSAGTYTLYAIPNKDSWKVLLNAQTDTEGAFFYNPELNIAEVTVPVKESEFLEHFSIGFKNRNDKLSMVLAWDRIRVSVPIALEHPEELVVRR